MNAHLDSFSPGLAYGWAVDPDDTSERLDIRVQLGSDVVASASADIYRADLEAAGIGDGYHGFSINLDFGLYQRIIERLSEFSVVVVSPATDKVGAVQMNEAICKSLEASHTGFSGLRIIGASFLSDNLSTFGKQKTQEQPNEIVATYVAFKMHAFHSGPWIQNGDYERPSAKFWLDQLGARTVEQIKTGAIKLLFDMSNEGICFEYSVKSIRGLNRDLAELGINPSSCAVITQNRVFERDYLIWSFREGLTNTLGIFCYDYYVRRFVGIAAGLAAGTALKIQVDRFILTLRNVRSRRFICLNFTPRPHRIAIVSWLLEMGYDRVGYISFKGLNMLKLDASASSLPVWYPDMEIAQRGFEKLKAIGTIDLDLVDQHPHYIPEFDLGPEAPYLDSYFSIVTETDAEWGTLRRFTEKIFKPIARFHPFVVLGNGQTLHLLRSLGFKTFDPWIDEDYDIMDDPRKRTELAMEEIKKLIHMDESQIKDFYEGVAEILIFNFVHLHTGLNDFYRNSIEPKIVEDLKVFAAAKIRKTKACLPARIPDHILEW